MKCSKCGNEPQETDKLVWKCTSCGKAYRVKLSYLRKLQEKKNSSGVASLLKCKECGEPLDNGNEQIYWKCSCGNVQSGKLGEYGETTKISNPNLIKCPECGREKVSKTAEMCPDCGYGIKAHFQKIEQKKLLEQQKLEREKQCEEAKRMREEKEQAELDTIKMPSKPSIGQNLLIFGIVFLPFMLLGLLLPYGFGFWFFMIFWLIVAFSSYNDNVKDYERAQQDFRKFQKEELSKKKMEEYRKRNAPKCPMCGSTNIEKISTTSRAVSVAAVGLASGKIGKQYKCKNCKHMW